MFHIEAETDSGLTQTLHIAALTLTSPARGGLVCFMFGTDFKAFH